MSCPLLKDVQLLPIHYAPIGHTAPLSFGPDDIRVALQATLTAPPIPGLLSRFIDPPPGYDDPLLPAVTRFVAARPFTGPRALMRRFGIGLQRARGLLTELQERRLVRGHWCRQAAVAFLNDREVWAFRMYRVQPWAWGSLQGGA